MRGTKKKRKMNVVLVHFLLQHSWGIYTKKHGNIFFKFGKLPNIIFVDGSNFPCKLSRRWKIEVCGRYNLTNTCLTNTCGR